MDENPSGHVQVFIYQSQNSDVLDLIGPLTDLFPQQNGRTASASSQQNPLLQRQTQAATLTSITASSTIGSGSGGMVP